MGANGILSNNGGSPEPEVKDLSSKLGKTLRHCGRRAAQVARGVVWDLARGAIERPIFVVGCSRAGTTLVYKCLAKSKEVGSLNRETHDFWVALHPLADKNWRSHTLLASDASSQDVRVVSRYFFTLTGMRRVVDKNNQNGLCVPYLHALFHDAHFVYVKRSPGDNLHSLIEGWGKADEFATWSKELPAKVAIGDGRYSRWCFFLPEGWRSYLNAPIEEVCAFQYTAINRAILDARAIVPPAQWTEVLYEDLVRDPVSGFRGVFGSLGLTFTPQLAKFCEHVLETPFNAFSEIRLDKWKSQGNRTRIERVIPKVAAVAREMGYRSE